MGAPRAIASLVTLGACAVLAAGCGGGGGSSAAGTTTQPARGRAKVGPAIKKRRIRVNWTTFFDGSTSTAKRVNLLEHGRRFRRVLERQARSPLARKSSAKVSKVTLRGPARATVRYTLLLGGKPALKSRTGTALLEIGQWKVSDSTFCRLLALEGTRPGAC